MKKGKFLKLSVLLCLTVSTMAFTGCGKTDGNTEQETVSGATQKNETESNAQDDEFLTGIYQGSHKKEAMGSEIVYTYTIELKEDGTYHYEVSFPMGEETYTEEENGSYSVKGTTISMISSEGTETSGTYADTKLTVSRKVSSFASEAVELELTQK